MLGSCGSIMHVYFDAAKFRSGVTASPDDKHLTLQDLGGAGCTAHRT